MSDDPVPAMRGAAEQEPGELKVYYFSRLRDGLRRLPGRLWKWTQTILLGITPDVPETIGTAFEEPSIRRALIGGFLAAEIACGGVVTLLSLLEGTWSGSDPRRLYFAADRTNLVNYFVLCPLYVAFSAALAVCAAAAWRKTAPAPLGPGDPLHRRLMPLSIGVPLLFGIGAAVTTNYMRECLSPRVYPKLPWYCASNTLADGGRALNTLGIYYVLLNYSLLLMCLVGALSVLVLMTVSYRTGLRLRALPATDARTIEHLRQELTHFTWGYLFAKLLTATLMLNAQTWKWERPAESVNLQVFGGFLLAFGVLFVSFPRYYVELEWFHFKARRASADGDTAEVSVDDVRERMWMKTVAHVLDGLVIGGFALTFYG